MASPVYRRGRPGREGPALGCTVTGRQAKPPMPAFPSLGFLQVLTEFLPGPGREAGWQRGAWQCGRQYHMKPGWGQRRGWDGGCLSRGHLQPARLCPSCDQNGRERSGQGAGQGGSLRKVPVFAPDSPTPEAPVTSKAFPGAREGLPPPRPSTPPPGSQERPLTLSA